MNGRPDHKNDSVGKAYNSAVDTTVSHEPGSIGSVLTMLKAFAAEQALLKLKNPAQAKSVENTLKELFPQLVSQDATESTGAFLLSHEEVDKFAGLLYTLGSMPERERITYIKILHTQVNVLSNLIVSSDKSAWRLIDRTIALLKLFNAADESDRLFIIDLLHDAKQRTHLNQIIEGPADLLILLHCFSKKNRLIVFNKVKDDIAKWVSYKEVFEVMLTVFDQEEAARLRVDFATLPSIPSLMALCDALNMLRLFHHENNFDYAKIIFSAFKKEQLSSLINSGHDMAMLCGFHLPHTLVLSFLNKKLSDILQDIEDGCDFFDIVLDNTLLKELILELGDWFTCKLTSAKELETLRLSIGAPELFQVVIQLLESRLKELVKNASMLSDYLFAIGKENRLLLLLILADELPTIIKSQEDFQMIYGQLPDDARTQLIHVLKNKLADIINDKAYHTKLLDFYKIETAEHLSAPPVQGGKNQGWWQLFWFWKANENKGAPLSKNESVTSGITPVVKKG